MNLESAKDLLEEHIPFHNNHSVDFYSLMRNDGMFLVATTKGKCNECRLEINMFKKANTISCISQKSVETVFYNAQGNICGGAILADIRNFYGHKPECPDCMSTLCEAIKEFTENTC